MPDYVAYRKSISNELIDIKDRVRNFIGGDHPPEEGRYKEIILSECLQNHLPANVRVGTGFIFNRYNQKSHQIDIIVYRNNYPLLFQTGNFIIAPEEAVLAIIEVKTTLDWNNLVKTIEHATENGSVVMHPIFNGIFSYDYGFGEDIRRSRCLESSLKNSHGGVNYLCLGPNYFTMYWNAYKDGRERDQYRIYRIEKLAFGYFIGNLIEDVYNNTVSKQLPKTLANVLYPIEGTKEAYCEHVINCQNSI